MHAHKQFEAWVDAAPATVAIEHGVLEWSYSIVDQVANGIAWHLLRHSHVTKDERVGICMTQGMPLVAAIIGVWKAGSAFAILDPADPDERLSAIAADAALRSVIAHEDDVSRLQQSLPCSVVPFERCKPQRRRPHVQTSDANLAYVVYTSGSSGRPKGVMVPHRGIPNLALSIRDRWGIGPGDRVLQYSSPRFDGFVWDLVSALLTGATMIVIDSRKAIGGSTLSAELHRHRVNVMFLVPSVAATLEPRECEQIRLLVLAGEASTAELVNRWVHPGRLVINAYGPAEATVAATWGECVAGTEPPAIGAPLPNVRVHLIDEDGAEIADGRVGELCISGIGVAAGYLNMPELSAEKFVAHPLYGDQMYRTGDLARWLPNGDLSFIGRLDHQVKVRGCRVELEEIEAVISAVPWVREVVVVARTTPLGARIEAFLTARSGMPADIDELRRRTAERLPKFMFPHRYEVLAEIPRTGIGKVDRAALEEFAPNNPSEPIRTANGPVEPLPPSIQTVFQTWNEVLERNSQDLNSNFYQQGGDSLLVVELVERVRNRLGLSLEHSKEILSGFLQSPTLSTMARLVADNQLGGSTRYADDYELSVDFACYRPATITASPMCALVTGGTGFLGRYLIREIALQTSATVICHVRAHNEADARSRIRTAFRSANLDLSDLDDRLEVVCGDLAERRLGLSERSWASLRDRVDTVYHNGALVNFIYPYEALRAANVRSVHEVLDLAARGNMKTLNYVSTLAVLVNEKSRGDIVDETVPALEPVDLRMGYARSKAVAERCLQNARDLGVDVRTYRPEDIGGDSRSGYWNTRNAFLPAVLKACVDASAMPELDHPLDIVAVDEVARMLVGLSLANSARSRVFHLNNPMRTSVAEFAAAAADHGRHVEKVPYDAWVAKLVDLAKGDTRHPLKPFLNLFEDGHKPSSPSTFDLYGQERVPVFACAARDRVVNRFRVSRTSDLWPNYVRYFVESGFM